MDKEYTKYQQSNLNNISDEDNNNSNNFIQNNILKFSDNNDYTTTRYLLTIILSVFIYTLFAWASEISFTEILDLELPLLIVFSLIITKLGLDGYTKLSYLVYIMLTILFYFISPTIGLFLIIALSSELIIECFKKIYYNKYDFKNTKEYDINPFIKHVLRVRYHILLSFVIFIIFMLLGYLYPGVFQTYITPAVQGLQEGVKQGTVQLETVSLFTNNITVAINMILGGLYFSTMTIYLLAYNAIVVGFTGSTMNLGHFIAFTAPHGIIELFAIILAGAAGFRATHAILTLLSGIKLKEDTKKEIFENHLVIFTKMIGDVVILSIIITILLIVAAYAEANLTIPLGQYLVNTIL